MNTERNKKSTLPVQTTRPNMLQKLNSLYRFDLFKIVKLKENCTQAITGRNIIIMVKK